MAAWEASHHAIRTFAAGAALAVPDELAGAHALAVLPDPPATAFRIRPRIVVAAVRVLADRAGRAMRVTVRHAPAVRVIADEAVGAFAD